MILSTVKSNFTIQFFTFFSSILIARFLDPEGRGELALIFLYPQIVSNILILGFDKSIGVIGGTNKISYPISTIFFASFILSIPSIIIANSLINIYFNDLKIIELSTTYLLYITPAYFFTISVGYLNGMGLFKEYNALRLIFYVSNLLLIIVSGLLFFSSEKLINYFVYSSILSTYVVFLVAFYLITRLQDISLKFNIKIFLEDMSKILKLAPKFFLIAFFVQSSAFGYQIVTNSLLGPEALGILIIMVTYSRLASPIGQAIAANFFRFGIIEANEENLEKIFRLSLITYFIIFLLLALISNSMITLIFGASYVTSDSSIYILLLSYFFAIQTDTLSEYLYGKKIIFVDLLCRGIYLLSFISISFLLNEDLYLKGIVIAIFIGEFLRFVSLIFFIDKITNLKIKNLFKLDKKDFLDIWLTTLKLSKLVR